MGDIGTSYRILSLDGGGSLGVYTLGVLSEIEKAIGVPLHETFELIYGTSTGSIIASMIALGNNVETIRNRYFEIIPDVMCACNPKRRTSRLQLHSDDIYKEKTFDKFVTNIGIVTTDLELNRPMVFKSDVLQSHRMSSSFQPGFGCRIADAVVASCAAFPFFKKKELRTSAGPKVLVDGGFAANNPALLALTDSVGPLGLERNTLRLLSVGTGSYPEKVSTFQRLLPVQTFITLLGTNAKTVDGLRQILFSDIKALRIDESFSERQYRTNFLESDKYLLEKIYELGRNSFAADETAVKNLLL